MRSNQFSTTLANGLSVLQCFRSGEPALTNRELVNQTGLSKATISRLTYTLVLKGLLTYDKELRRYRLGAGVLALGYPLLAGVRLRQVARPYMQALAEETGGSVSIGTFQSGNMIYLDTCRGHDVVAFRPDIGARLPLLVSAMGRAWLAQFKDNEKALFLGQMGQPSSPANPALSGTEDVARTWLRARHEYAQYGYCTSAGEWLADVHALATPWHQQVDGDILVFNCGVPATRLQGRSIHDYGPKLLAMMAQIREASDVAE